MPTILTLLTPTLAVNFVGDSVIVHAEGRHCVPTGAFITQEATALPNSAAVPYICSHQPNWTGQINPEMVGFTYGAGCGDPSSGLQGGPAALYLVFDDDEITAAAYAIASKGLSKPDPVERWTWANPPPNHPTADHDLALHRKATEFMNSKGTAALAELQDLLTGTGDAAEPFLWRLINVLAQEACTPCKP